MNEINLGTLKIPINAATKTFAVLAKRGAGKTYTGAVMAEEFHKSNIPFVVFDPIDVWWGLKLNKDGKNKGLPIVIFGLEHADIKLDRDMGRKIAQAVVKYNISAVISTFGMPKVAQRHLIAEFSDEILNINNTPRHIFIEEAHEYVPQKVMGGLGVCFNAVSNLVVMGRNRGLGVTLLNQRAATLNKDVLTQVDSLIAMRSVGPQDRKALREWVEYHTAEGDFDKFLNELPSLPNGTAWIWSPEFLGIFEKIKIRERETYHPDREKIGLNFVMPTLEQTDVQEFIQEFSQQVEKEKPSKGDKFKDNSKDLCPICGRKTVGLSGFCRKHFTSGNNSVKDDLQREQELVKIKNDYETKIMQKDLEIKNKDLEIKRDKDLINKIHNLILERDGKPIFFAGSMGSIQVPNSQLEMWLTKLGNSMPSRILKFLAEHSNNAYTREQLALALGASRQGVSNTAIPLLKRNLLIKEESGKLRVNPDL